MSVASASAPSVSSQASITSSAEAADSLPSSPGLAEGVPTSSPELSGSVMVFTTTLPSDLPAQLSSVHISEPSPTNDQNAITTAPLKPTLSGQALLSNSVAGVLKSAGLPALVVSSLAPMIVGSPPEAGPTASSSTINLEQEQQRAAIDAVLQWIVSFFHIH